MHPRSNTTIRDPMPRRWTAWFGTTCLMIGAIALLVSFS